MRNLIQGKTGILHLANQVGYKKKTIDYKEGDIWTENKKKWTIKNGIKQTISKLDAIKKEVFVPLCCPKCSKVIKHRLDKPQL
jgi:3-methyladenine DNA glycosylase AlkC